MSSSIVMQHGLQKSDKHPTVSVTHFNVLIIKMAFITATLSL